jgi:hypothetical protein
MWKYFVERGKPQMTIWRVSIASSRLKSTNTHTHTLRLCNTYCFPTATVFARTPFNVTLYSHCLYCWLYCRSYSSCSFSSLLRYGHIGQFRGYLQLVPPSFLDLRNGRRRVGVLSINVDLSTIGNQHYNFV